MRVEKPCCGVCVNKIKKRTYEEQQHNQTGACREGRRYTVCSIQGFTDWAHWAFTLLTVNAEFDTRRLFSHTDLLYLLILIKKFLNKSH